MAISPASLRRGGRGETRFVGSSLGRAFTLLEVTIACALFILLSGVLVVTLNRVTDIWRRSNSRDEAVRQLVKAKTALVRDLANGSGQPGQFANATVPGHLGTGYDGDALTFLTPDDGTTSSTWSTQTTGQAALGKEVTYYLVIPNAPNSYGITCSVGSPDSASYEQQCPFKWLIRLVNNAPTGAPQAVSTSWATWLTQPSSLSSSSTFQVVADQMFQFRVLSTAPLWSIQMSAVAISDASHKVGIGSTALEQSPFTLVEQFTVPTNN